MVEFVVLHIHTRATGRASYATDVKEDDVLGSQKRNLWFVIGWESGCQGDEGVEACCKAGYSRHPKALRVTAVCGTAGAAAHVTDFLDRLSFT